jgi:hypothetical protein
MISNKFKFLGQRVIEHGIGVNVLSSNICFVIYHLFQLNILHVRHKKKKKKKPISKFDALSYCYT